MQHVPIFLDVRGRDVLVVGGNTAAQRKAAVLAGAGARLTVVAAELCRSVKADEAEGDGADADAAAVAALEALSGPGGGVVRRRGFRPRDVAGKALVVCASDDEALNRRVSRAAHAAGVPVNVVDRPALCSFVWPAIVDRDPVTVAVCSAGTAPVLARAIRARIEAMLPANLGRLARFAERFRGAVKAMRPTGLARRRFWDGFFEGPVAALVLAGEEGQAHERMLALINRRDEASAATGRVTLVGAGPGDPELLTLKALRALQEADVIVHDRLVGPGILDYARRDADRIDVGKAKGRHGPTQAEINALLARHARAGLRVVRLKGGDPFIFGRGGEEQEYLQRHGIPVAVIPGITAATGCAAALGLPLTHRDGAQALTLVTAHGREGEPDLDWRALARGGQTIAVYMGASVAGSIAARLIEHGCDPATPAAVVAHGTLSGQRSAAGALQELPRLADAVGPGPALIVIGAVVRYSQAWATRAVVPPAAQPAMPERACALAT